MTGTFAGAMLPTLECPRCGYDLRGEVSAWSEWCPVAGVCGECGLAFEWRKIVTATPEVAWLVESGSRFRLRRFRQTLMRSLTPVRFWRELDLASRWRPGRLLRYALLLLLCGLIPTCVESGLDRAESSASAGVDSGAFWAAVVGATLAPWSWEPVDTWMDRVDKGWSGRGSAPTNSLVFGDWVEGGWRRGARTLALPPLATWLEATRSLRELLFVALAGQAGALLAMAALPVSRRRARVRWRHVVRGAIYGLVNLWPVLIAGVALPCTESVVRLLVGIELSPMRRDLLRLVAWAGAMFLVALWWRAAVRHYLRMEHPRAIAASVALVAIVCSLTAIAYGTNGLVRIWFHVISG